MKKPSTKPRAAKMPKTKPSRPAPPPMPPMAGDQMPMMKKGGMVKGKAKC